MNQPRLRGQKVPIAVGLFAVLAAAAAFTPLTGLVIWLMPVPFIVLTVHHSRFLPVVLAVVTALVLVFAGAGIGTIVFALGIYMAGWVMGESMTHAKNAYPALIAGTLVFVMMGLVGLAFLYWSGVHLQAELQQQSALSLQMYQPMLHLSPAQIQQMSTDAANRIATAIPAIIVILSLVAAVLNYVIARRFAGVPEISQQTLLSTWRLPPSAIWVYVVATLCVAAGVGKDSSYWWSAVNNAFLLAGFFIAIQGIALVWRRINRLHLRYLWLVVVAIAALFLNSLFVLLGLLDSMLSARRLR